MEKVLGGMEVALKDAEGTDALIRDMLLREHLEEQVRQVQELDGKEAQEVLGKLREKKEGVEKRLEGYNEEMIRIIEAVRSAIRRHGKQKAPDEIGHLVDRSIEERRKVVEAISGWEEAIG